jgi:hypothetical protein
MLLMVMDDEVTKVARRRGEGEDKSNRRRRASDFQKEERVSD